MRVGHQHRINQLLSFLDCHQTHFYDSFTNVLSGLFAVMSYLDAHRIAKRCCNNRTQSDRVIWIRELIRLLIRNIGDINGLVIQEQQELITSIIIMQILILQVWIVLRQHLSVASGWSKMKDIF